MQAGKVPLPLPRSHGWAAGCAEVVWCPGAGRAAVAQAGASTAARRAKLARCWPAGARARARA
eukprot:8327360-Lingulodinium_polyedra.AAC.1